MKKIVTITEASIIARELKAKRQKIVLVGGCFDILHPGHIALLQKAKQQGDYLFVLLESDEHIAKHKGSNRPIYPQAIRAKVLEELRSVDYIVLLPYLRTNDEYDATILSLHPQVIATTKGDPGLPHKIRQAKRAYATIAEVIAFLPEYATSKLVEKLSQEL